MVLPSYKNKDGQLSRAEISDSLVTSLFGTVTLDEARAYYASKEGSVR